VLVAVTEDGADGSVSCKVSQRESDGDGRSSQAKSVRVVQDRWACGATRLKRGIFAIMNSRVTAVCTIIVVRERGCGRLSRCAAASRHK